MGGTWPQEAAKAQNKAAQGFARSIKAKTRPQKVCKAKHGRIRPLKTSQGPIRPHRATGLCKVHNGHARSIKAMQGRTRLCMDKKGKTRPHKASQGPIRLCDTASVLAEH